MFYENILIFLAIMILFMERSRFKLYPKNFSNFPVIFLLFAYAISTIFSINIQNSIRETLKFISFFAIFFMVSQSDEKQKKLLLKTIVIAASIISLYSIYQYFWGYGRTLDYLQKTNSDFLSTSSYARDILLSKRAIGTFPSPNILAGYLIIMFFLAMHLQRRISLVLITAALILTKSMGAWLSLIAALIYLGNFVSYPKGNLRSYRGKLMAVLIVAILCFILVNRWERLMNMENPQNSITQRLNYWRTAIAIIKDQAIFGVGPGNFQEVFLGHKVGLGTDTRYAHNIFLHIWSEIGILGLVGVFYLIINFFRKARSQSSYRFILCGGLVFILHNLIDNTFFMPQAALFWWILLASKE
ncbi:MAG: O-antigen ligase family protein [Candidatus Gorgyraea atricola]|nr:O-antigen ligase family protein [Candidatus Gorgyraea atricola]